MNLIIQEYHDGLQDLWDEFVLRHSGNGTIFHTRKFLSYHDPSKFEDRSILLYNNEVLIAVVNVCKNGTSYYSHKGTSGGGPVIHKDFFDVVSLSVIVDSIRNHYQDQLECLITEEIFPKVNSRALLFLMGKNKNVINELSAYFNLKQPVRDVSSRLLTGIKSVYNSDITLAQCDSEQDYRDFHEMLSQNLERYDTKPVHSLSELLKLRNLLGNDQFLYLAKENSGLLCGVWVIRVTDDIWHTQYIARDYNHSNQYVLSALLLRLKDLAIDQKLSALSLGSCSGGKDGDFSESLCNFKQKLGTELCFRYYIRNK